MIIVDRVRRACPPFGDVRMRAYAFRGVLQDTRQPNVGEAQILNCVEGNFVNVVESATAVFYLAAVKVEADLLVTKQSRKELIDVHFSVFDGVKLQNSKKNA